MTKNNIVKSLLVFVLFLIFFVAIGCKEKEPELTLSCDVSSIEITEGETYKANGVVNEGYTIEWVSSNEEIATVVDGTITAHKAGTATIELSIKDHDAGTIKITVTVKEKPIDLDYFKNHLDTEGFTSYLYKEVISDDELEIHKVETIVTLVNSKYEIKEVTTKLGDLSSTTPYVETEKEETVDTIGNPISLVLDETYFQDMVFAKNLFETKVLNDKTLEFLGIDKIIDITLSISLNSNLKVEKVEINYTDLDTGYDVKLTVNFSY